MLKVVKTISIICFVVTASFSAQKRAFTIEDLYKVKYVGAPVLSTDETKVAFTVSENDLQNTKSNTQIYVMNSDGTNLRKVSSESPFNFSPIWSNDNSKLYFTSYRNGKAQLFYFPMNGGDAVQVTNTKLGINSPKLSHNNNLVIFSTKVFPECGIDESCNNEISDAIANGPIQAHLSDSLFIRHWTEYNDGEYNHVVLYNVEKDEYTDLTPGAFNSPAFAAGGSDNYNFSPDGTEIAFDSKRVADPEASTNVDIWTVDIDGNNLKNITSNNKGADTHPIYSPDGKYIAYLTQIIPTYESDRIRIALYNRITGENKIITDSFDNWVNSFEWSSDSKSIYFTGHQKGYMPLFKIDLATLEITEVVKSKSIRAFTVSNKNNKVYYSYSLIGQPSEIESQNLSNGNQSLLTQFNKELTDSVDIRSGEQVWVEGADGKKCHMFIVKPHNFDPNKKYPLVINVHGGPQYQWMDSFRGDWQVYPGAGYVVAFPNPHGSTGYGQEYTAAISGDWDGKVYKDVMAATDYLANLPYVDKDRMGAMGWSYGGYFMNLLQAKTHKFKCLASMMGIYDLSVMTEETEELWFTNWDLKRRDDFVKMSPHMYTDNFNTPTLIITGEKDYRIPYTQSVRYFTVLQEKGIDSRLIVFTNDGHWPSNLKSMPLYYNAHLEWFHKYLGGGKAPWNSKDMVRNSYLNK